MKNMDKGLTVPKWVLIVWLKIPQMPQNLSAQFVCPSPKVMYDRNHYFDLGPIPKPKLADTFRRYRNR